MPGLGGPGDGSRPVRPDPGASGQAGSPTWRPGRRGGCVHQRPWPRCRSAGPGVGQASSHPWAPACAPPIGYSARMAHFHARLLERVASAHPMLLWLAGAAAMGLSGNRSARRAALRGTGSVVLASAGFSDSPSPGSSRRGMRPRPRRSLPPSPWSRPGWELPLVPIAAGVAASRAHTDGHSPGEVLAGVAVGVGIAATTCRWWPLHLDEPAETARPNVPVPALPAATRARPGRQGRRRPRWRARHRRWRRHSQRGSSPGR